MKLTRLKFSFKFTFYLTESLARQIVENSLDLSVRSQQEMTSLTNYLFISSICHIFLKL